MDSNSYRAQINSEFDQIGRAPEKGAPTKTTYLSMYLVPNEAIDTVFSEHYESLLSGTDTIRALRP